MMGAMCSFWLNIFEMVDRTAYSSLAKYELLGKALGNHIEWTKL